MVKYFFYKLRRKRMTVLEMWNSTEIILDFKSYTHEVNVSIFKYKYSVSGWDVFNSLHSSLYDSVTGIFVRKIALIAHDCRVCCNACRVSRLSLFPPYTTVSMLGVSKEMGGDAARTADPQGSEEYPIPYDICSAIKIQGKKNKAGTLKD